jgi:IclR family KDG regulon transcriptional repressor
MPQTKQKTPLSNTVLKGFQVLDLFTRREPALTAKQAAERIGLPFSSVYRMLVTMTKGGFLDYSPDTRKYRLGLKLLEYAGIVQDTLDVREIARSCMLELCKMTQETVHLMVPSGLKGVFINRIESPQNLRTHAIVGQRVPLYVGATARAILAFSGKEVEEAIIIGGLEPVTENTIVSPEVLKAENARCRKLGYCISRGELNPGTAVVAAPISDSTGKAIASIAIAAPAFRLSDKSIGEFAQMARQGAIEVSSRFGFSRLA